MGFSAASSSACNSARILINLLAIGGVLGVARRCGGRRATLWAALLAACYVRFMSVPWLTDVWLPWVVILPLLATVFLCAAVISGRVYCLPAAAFVASFIVQTQMGYTVALAALMLLSLLALAPRPRSLAGPGPSAVRQPAESDGDHRAHFGHCLDADGDQAGHGDAGPGLGNRPLFRRARRRPLLAGGGEDARLHDGGVSRLACRGRSEAAAIIESFDGPSAHRAIVLLLAIPQLVLLPLGYLLARRLRRDFDAAMCLLAAVLIPLCLFSIRRLAGDIVFHHVFWMTALGLLNIYAIGAVRLLDSADGCDAAADPGPNGRPLRCWPPSD